MQTGNADFEHCRPKSNVMESPDHPGYWWLVNEWDNLLIACANCNRRSWSKDGVSGKANRFPLKDEAKHIESQFSRLDNLFNPFVPLVDAEKWLLSLSDLHFRRAAIVIKDLLRMSENDEIS
ncbi:MAG: hypothetical protein ACI9P5_001326 [Saprospiraceae bacterium]